MKILLVSASIEEYWRAPAIESNSHYPLGLAYLHAVLELRNHTVKTLFLNDFDYAESTRIVTEEIASFCPQVVGFNLLTANRVNTFSLINHIEENHGQIQVLLGGIHATNMSRQLLETYPTAIVVVGDQAAIDVRHGKQLGSIGTLDAATVEDLHLVSNNLIEAGQLATNERVYILRLLW